MTRQEAGKRGNEALVRNYHKKYYDSPNYCTYCNATLSYKQRHNKFCSHSCAAKHNNPKREMDSKKACAYCGENWVSYGRKFCSEGCRLKSQEDIFWKKLQNGENNRPATIKKYLIKFRGHQCEACNTKKWNDRDVPLNIHHIDGNPLNNKVENLQILCPNCHAQTDSYCSKNKGGGRYYRRMYDRKMAEKLKAS